MQEMSASEVPTQKKPSIKKERSRSSEHNASGGVAALPIIESIVPKPKVKKDVMDDLDDMLEDMEGGSEDDLDDLLDEIGMN